MRREMVLLSFSAFVAAFASTRSYMGDIAALREEVKAARAAYHSAQRRLAQAEGEAQAMANATNAVAAVPSPLARHRKFFENRRICVRRDTATIPGSVITYWWRNGAPDTKGPAVVTNVLHSIAGAAQDNPLQARIAELVERVTGAEARAARLDALRSWLVEQRDKAVLPTTKAIYQAIIDRIDERSGNGQGET